MTFEGRALSDGEAGGAVAAIAPLSFWGGYDAEAGVIIDRHHPACGQRLAGRVLVMTAGRGSSSSSAVLSEAIRLGTAPAAIILAEPDPILVVGAMVAGELYGRQCPVVVLAAPDFAAVAAAGSARVTAAGGAARVTTSEQARAP